MELGGQISISKNYILIGKSCHRKFYVAAFAVLLLGQTTVYNAFIKYYIANL